MIIYQIYEFSYNLGRMMELQCVHRTFYFLDIALDKYCNLILGHIAVQHTKFATKLEFAWVTTTLLHHQAIQCLLLGFVLLILALSIQASCASKPT